MPSKNYFSPPTVQFSFKIFRTVKEFSPTRWDKIAADKIFLHTNYLQALENSAPAGISFRYVLVYENSTLKAICNFQVADLSSKELGSIINLENYGDILSTIGNKINNMLFSDSKYTSNNLVVCGSLFVSGEYGIAVEEEKLLPMVFKIFPEVLSKITEGIEKDKGRVVAVSVKDFYEREDVYAKELTNEKFHRMVIDPNMIFKVRNNWKTFDDYLGALSSKYRVRANSVAEKLGSVHIKYLEISEIEKERESIEKLYYNVQKKAPVRIVKSDVRYFYELKKHLKDDFVFRAFYLDGKMIAFTSGFKKLKQYEAHFIGIDYHYNKSHAIYQNILYDFIHEAIKNNATELVFGRTAMEIKSTVGAIAIPLFSYIRFTNGILNRIIKTFIPTEENKNWIPRNPFKE